MTQMMSLPAHSGPFGDLLGQRRNEIASRAGFTAFASTQQVVNVLSLWSPRQCSPLLKQFRVEHKRFRSSPSGACADPERPMTRTLAFALVLFLLTVICGAPLAGTDIPAEHHAARKIVKKVLPAYPDLARQLNIKGTVKLLVTVEPNGIVKSAKDVGGNPAFVAAAMRVIGKWKFEPAPEQTTETVELKFEPSE